MHNDKKKKKKKTVTPIELTSEFFENHFEVSVSNDLSYQIWFIFLVCNFILNEFLV